MTDQTPTTCVALVLRGPSRKRRHEFCGRDATHYTVGIPINVWCKMHVSTKRFRNAVRVGAVVPIG